MAALKKSHASEIEKIKKEFMSRIQRMESQQEAAITTLQNDKIVKEYISGTIISSLDSSIGSVIDHRPGQLASFDASASHLHQQQLLNDVVVSDVIMQR